MLPIRESGQEHKLIFRSVGAYGRMDARWIRKVPLGKQKNKFFFFFLIQEFWRLKKNIFVFFFLSILFATELAN